LTSFTKSLYMKLLASSNEINLFEIAFLRT
jgi:hypothetical protein